MISDICVANIPVQIKYPKEINEQVSTLTRIFRSSKRSHFKLYLELCEIECNWQTLTQVEVQQKLICLDKLNKRTLRAKITANVIEAVSAAVGLFLVAVLADNHGLLLHGAFIKRNGLAYIFLGKSGAGKSTISKNASGVEIVHDDKIAVRRINGRWWAFGVPLCDNARRTGKNSMAPLAGVYILEQNSRLSAYQLEKKFSLVQIAQNVLLPFREWEIARNVSKILMAFVIENKCYRLCFAKNSDVVEIL
jgi:hypothetical protein